MTSGSDDALPTHYLQRELENLVRESPSVFRFIEEGSLDGLWYWDLIDGDAEWMSDRFWSVLGVDPATKTASASEWQAIIDPHDREVALANAKAHMANPDHPYDQVVRYRHADGHTVWVRCRGIAIRDGDGVPVRMLGAHNDISDVMRRQQALERAEQQLRVSFDNAPIGMVLARVDGSLFAVNDAFCDFVQRDRASLLKADYQSITHPDDVESSVGIIESLIHGELRSAQAEKRYLLPDGSPVWGMLSVSVARDTNGEPLHFIAQVKDLNKEKEARQVAERAEALFRASFDDSSSGQLLVSLDPGELGCIAEANNAAERILRTDDLPGNLFIDFIGPDHRSEADSMLNTLAQSGSRFELEWQAQPSYDEQSRWVRAVGTRVGEHSDSNPHALVQIEDITERKDALERLEHMANHDLLTGLPNRSLAVDRLEQGLARARRRNSRVGLLFLDLDNFKVVNDSLGHPAGDELLRAVAAVIVRVVRESDTAARFGGDEFIVICDDLPTDLAEAERVLNATAERISDALLTPIEASGGLSTVRVSIGARLSNGSEDTAQLMISDADAALYRAKSLGRSRTQMFETAMRQRAVDRMNMERELRDAIREHQLSVVYQPIANLISGEVSHAEALVRWNHPEKGVILPGRFIEIAEDTGLIVPLGEFVFEQVLQDLQRFPKELNGMRVAINASARQIGQTDFAGLVRQGLDRHQLQHRVSIELTESAMLQAYGSMRRQIDELRARGIPVGVDDFGTGYATLSSVRALPVDFLKIDSSFVERVAEDAADKAIVSSILALASGLGLGVIAEGIETTAQRDTLIELGCTLGQGYLMSPPIPPGRLRDKVLAA